MSRLMSGWANKMWWMTGRKEFREMVTVMRDGGEDGCN